ncbi:MAG: rod shape-determining protein [Candidatus Dormibacterales bacterium]
MLAKRIGLDLGTCRLRVHVKGEGTVLDEPSLVAWDRGRSRVLAVGHEASPGRLDPRAELVRAVSAGEIADIALAGALLGHLIGRVDGRHRVFRPEVVVCVPSGATAPQRCALAGAALGAGARQAWLVDAPLAAAIGAELPIAGREAVALCDLGGGATRLVAIVENGVLAARSLPVGGEDLDMAVAAALLSGPGLTVGRATAEELKVAVGVAAAGPLTVEVRDAGPGATGSRRVEVAPEVVSGALQEPLIRIADALADFLSEVTAMGVSFAQKTVLLTGGGAQLRGLDRFLASRAGTRVAVAAAPATCAVRGAALALDEFAVLKRHQGYVR